MVGFNEIVLQNEGFFFRVGDNGFNVHYLFQHGEGFHILTLSFLEIGIYPVSNISCLPDIENGLLFIFK